MDPQWLGWHWSIFKKVAVKKVDVKHQKQSIFD
jgi:hypothetical protein